MRHVLELLRGDGTLLPGLSDALQQVLVGSNVPRDEELLQATERSVRHGLAALHDYRVPTEGELSDIAVLATLTAARRLPVESLLQAHRRAVRELWRRFSEAGGRDLPAPLPVLVVEAMWFWADTAATRLASVHHDAEVDLLRRHQDSEVTFLTRLLAGDLPAHERVTAAAAFGLRPDTPYRALRGTLLPGGSAQELAQLLSAGKADRGGLVVPLAGEVVGVVAERPLRWLEGAVVGLGPAETWDRLPASFAIATRAADTARRFAKPGVWELSDLGLLPAVVADEQVGELVEQRVLAPLGPSPEPLLSALTAWLAAGRSVEQAAQALFVHQNTVRYRLRRLATATGLDLGDTEHLVLAWWAAQRATLGPPPDHET